MRLFLKVLFCSVAVVVLQTAAPGAGAQSASDDRLSVPFNPETAGSIQHTPSGQLYLTPPPAQPDKTFSGSIEIGVSASTGDTNNARYREYGDPRSGPTGNFDFSVGQ